MKFNVGDRVEHRIFGKGKVVEINSGIMSNSTLVQFDVKHPRLHDGNFCKGVYKEKTCWHFYEDELDTLILLKNKNFTKKDLKEGDVLILRNGIRGVFNGEKTSIGNQNKGFLRFWHINDDLTNNGTMEEKLDIVEVIRPRNFETIFKRQEKILDNTEKEYLKNIVNPFRKKIKCIVKEECDFGKGKKEYIRIDLKDGETGIKLPYFKKDSMYKNMEVSNNYTLKELEL